MVNCKELKNEKNWVRIKLGNFTLLNVPGARAKAKRYGAAILDGKDPVIARRELKSYLLLPTTIYNFLSLFIK
jgi:predicted GH43/DUF377 family glycosyl hydrolase